MSREISPTYRPNVIEPVASLAQSSVALDAGRYIRRAAHWLPRGRPTENRDSRSVGFISPHANVVASALEASWQ